MEMGAMVGMHPAVRHKQTGSTCGDVRPDPSVGSFGSPDGRPDTWDTMRMLCS